VRELDLNLESFESGLLSDRDEMIVQRDLQQAREAGIQDTPSFINGQRLRDRTLRKTSIRLLDRQLRKAENT
jgi:predicted DsbA family dithiol-disulfide isomerase